jgi:hypothetical protein
MLPIAPVVDSGLKDAIVRAPWWAMKKRPTFLSWHNQTRLDPGTTSHEVKRGASGEGGGREQ